MDTCRNCDKPTSGQKYCSTVCEDMDKHPAPRDDMEKFIIGLQGNAVYTADEVWNVIDDILDSVRLAEASATGSSTGEVWATVQDYVANRYGIDA